MSQGEKKTLVSGRSISATVGSHRWADGDMVKIKVRVTSRLLGPLGNRAPNDK